MDDGDWDVEVTRAEQGLMDAIRRAIRVTTDEHVRAILCAALAEWGEITGLEYRGGQWARDVREQAN